MSFETPSLFCKAGGLGCQVDRVCFLRPQAVVIHPQLSKTQTYRTRTFLTLFLKYRLKGTGEEETEIQTTALNIYLWIHLSMNVFSVCVRFLSQHVCTRLLTYTVYSWLGCEPGALESCVAFPHRFCTPTTRGHSLCLGLGGGRSAVPYSAVSPAFLVLFFIF